VLMDFAENYAFSVQDAVLGFRWGYTQATLHTFVVYRKIDNILRSESFCVISDSLRHEAVTVHVCIAKLLEQNFKNFINLCYHEADFGLSAEWHFFASSHGKSPCDGVGGTVKRLGARASLQRPVDRQILSPIDLFKFCVSEIKNIRVFYVSQVEIEMHRIDQEIRFENGHTVSGTREHHHFKPVNLENLQVGRISGEANQFTTDVSCSKSQVAPRIRVTDLLPGEFVACKREHFWWVGSVCEVSVEGRDILVDCLHPKGPSSSFTWPSRKDQVWIPSEHVIEKLPPPCSTSKGRTFRYAPDKILSIEKLFKNFQ